MNDLMLFILITVGALLYLIDRYSLAARIIELEKDIEDLKQNKCICRTCSKRKVINGS